MATLYPSVNRIMADTPASSMLLLRQLRVPRCEPSSRSNDGEQRCAELHDKDKEEAGMAASIIDYADVFPMSFGDDSDLDSSNVFSDAHGIDADQTMLYKHAASTRNVSESSAEPLLDEYIGFEADEQDVLPPPPYTPSASRRHYSRFLPAIGTSRRAQATGYTTLRESTSAPVPVTSFSAVKPKTSEATQPPLVLELFMGHRLANKVAQRRNQRRLQQLDDVHATWAGLGIDTRAIVEANSNQGVQQTTTTTTKEREASANVGVSRLQEVEAAKHLLPPGFWQPPNYGPEEVDRRLRKLGL